MSEDRFFSEVRSMVSAHRTEVPSSVYVGMRRKLWWSNFTRLSLTRFNMWYALMLLAGLGVGINTLKSEGNTATLSTEATEKIVQPEIVVAPENQVGNAAAYEVRTEGLNSTTLKQEKVNPKVNLQTTAQQQVKETSEENIDVYEHTKPEAEVIAPEVTNQNEIPSKQGTKRGMKITTYDSGSKKK